jgi:uncharacterized protein
MLLLAVEESALGEKGAIAHLYLKTIGGKGEVFTATYPLTEMDTQISARLAKDIACDYARHKCDKDFLYTIKSDSPIVGGPSGGAALAVITIAELLNEDIDEKVSVTGTINSGGIIGPVGGIKEKIKVAAVNGLETVLIPKGTRFMDTDDLENENQTYDLVELGKSLEVDVIEVSTVDEAYSYFVHKAVPEDTVVPEIDPKYRETMKNLAEVLCNRSRELEKGLSGKLYEEGRNLTADADASYANEEYYSAASFCFGASIKFLQSMYRNLNYDEVKEKLDELNEQRKKFEVPEYDSITDLQIFMVVEERLFETDSWLEKTNESLEQAKKNESYLETARNQVAYASERLYSAHAWSNFFDNKEEELRFDREGLKEGCIKKLAEAEERYQYVKIYFPSLVKETQEELGQAKKDRADEQYELCIFKAAKAKAEADVLLGVMGIKSGYVEQIIEEKLKAVGRILSEQTTFPIVAYSYYEYANNLKDEDSYSSLLYSEYALELADLSLYVEAGKEKFDLEEKKKIAVMIMVLLLLAVSIWFLYKK